MIAVMEYKTATTKQYADYLYNKYRDNNERYQHVWNKDWGHYREEIEKKIREMSDEENKIVPAPQQNKAKKKAKNKKKNQEKNKKRPKYGIVPPPSRLEGIESTTPR